MLIQFTGLSGAGKTSIALLLEQRLKELKMQVEIIDGDVFRSHLSKDLGFSKIDRCENIRRLGEAGALQSEKGKIVIISAINPYEEMRFELKKRYGAFLVYIQCELSILINRDPKGLYAKALLPKLHPERLNHFTGISDPYEIPHSPDLVIDTGIEPVEDSARRLQSFIFTQISTINQDKNSQKAIIK